MDLRHDFDQIVNARAFQIPTLTNAATVQESDAFYMSSTTADLDSETDYSSVYTTDEDPTDCAIVDQLRSEEIATFKRRNISDSQELRQLERIRRQRCRTKKHQPTVDGDRYSARDPVPGTFDDLSDFESLSHDGADDGDLSDFVSPVHDDGVFIMLRY